VQNLSFYTGQACCLCDEAKALLEQSQLTKNYIVEMIDVKSSHQLYHLYGARIPVLKRHVDGRELGWPFDLQQLTEFLA
jgi:hypothetical protein